MLEKFYIEKMQEPGLYQEPSDDTISGLLLQRATRVLKRSLISSFQDETLDQKSLQKPVQGQSETFLTEAVLAGDEESCRRILSDSESEIASLMACTSSEGKTVLHLAVEQGLFAITELLLNFGKSDSLNIPDNSLRTPLHLACINDHETIARLLVRNGVDVNIQDIWGNTPIHYIAINQSSSLFEFLIKGGADLTLKNNEGFQPFEIAKINKMSQSFCLMNVVPTPNKIEPKDTEEDLINTALVGCEILGHGIGLYNYHILRKIRKISYWENVYLVKNQIDDQLYAMKAIKKSKVSKCELFKKYAVNERNVLAEFSHPFIVNLRYAYQSESFLYLITDFSLGGRLQKYLSQDKSFEESRAKLYAAEIVLAIEAMHSANIIYRNLKLQNIELDEKGHIRLTDFTLAKTNFKKSTNSFFMNTGRVAPEMEKSNGHGKSADWYMLGELLHQMLVGTPALAKNSLPVYLSVSARDLMSKLLEQNPGKRLGVNGAEEIKRHSFFEGIDWEQVYNRELTIDLPDLEDISPVQMSPPEAPVDKSNSVSSSFLENWTYVPELNLN